MGIVSVLYIKNNERVMFCVSEKKIVLIGKNHEELLDLQSKATNLGIPSHLIRDAGHTEVAPNSVTVLALFGRESNVDRITGNLRLLK